MLIECYRFFFCFVFFSILAIRRYEWGPAPVNFIYHLFKVMIRTLDHKHICFNTYDKLR